MKRLIFLLALASPLFAQQINPTTQVQWQRLSGTADPATQGFACTLNSIGDATHAIVGEMYTQNSNGGPHFWECTNQSGVPTWWQVDTLLNGLIVTSLNPILINGAANTPVSSGTAVFSCPTCGQAALQMFPVPPDTNQGVFVPFTACNQISNNPSLSVVLTCNQNSAFVELAPGGIFNHNVSTNTNFTTLDPGIVTQLVNNGDTITAAYAMAYTTTGTAAPSSNCSGGAVGTPGFSNPNGTLKTTSLSGVNTGNLATIQCQYNWGESVYDARTTIDRTMSVQGAGLWLTYTGPAVTSSTAVNIGPTLLYSTVNRELSTNPYTPNYMFPLLVSQLPNNPIPSQNGAFPIYLVSDETNSTFGGACTGSGTAGDGFALCIGSGSGYTVWSMGGNGLSPSITSPDTSITVTPSPLTGAGTIGINFNRVNGWQGRQQFNGGITLGGALGVAFDNKGTAGQVLTSQGTGAIPIWSNAGSGTPGGSSGNLQYNNGTGGFAGDTSTNDDGAGNLTAVSYNANGTGAGFFTATAGSAPTGAAGKAVYSTDATNGYAEVNENNTGLSRVCTAGNGICSTTGTRQWSCQPGLGDGNNAITAATYPQSTCLNTTGATITITAIKCFTDNNGTSTMNVTNGGGTGLLTGAVTCTTSFASGTQSGTTTITNGDFLKFSFVSDGTSKQSTWVVQGTY